MQRSQESTDDIFTQSTYLILRCHKTVVCNVTNSEIAYTTKPLFKTLVYIQRCVHILEQTFLFGCPLKIKFRFFNDILVLCIVPEAWGYPLRLRILLCHVLSRDQVRIVAKSFEHARRQFAGKKSSFLSISSSASIYDILPEYVLTEQDRYLS